MAASMLGSLSRGARVARSCVAPGSLFGAGYACHWAGSQEETVPQLAACGAASTWIGASSCIRRLNAALPEDADWPREKLSKAESAELRALNSLVSTCSAKGLDSAWLRLIVLRRLVQADPEGLAVRGLVPTGGDGSDAVDVSATASEAPHAASGSAAASGQGITELANLVAENASALNASPGSWRGDRQALPEVAHGLRALLEGSPSSGDAGGGSASSSSSGGSGTTAAERAEALGREGVASAALAASLAVRWLAAERRRTALAAATGEGETPPLPPMRLAASAAAAAAASGDQAEQDVADVLEVVAADLVAVWRALARPPAAAHLQRSGVASALKASLSVLPPPRPLEERWPAKDHLPSALVAAVSAASRAGSGFGGLAPLLGLGLKSTAAAAPASRSGRDAAASASSAAASATSASASASSAPSSSSAAEASAAPSDKRSTLTGCIEVAVWLAVAAGAVALASEDGLGLLRFHAVPEKWRPMLKSLVHERAMMVEDLLAKYEGERADAAGVLGTPENMSDSTIMVGPWDAKTNYIEAPAAVAEPPHFNAPC
eukprot:TRINITY_DN4417_c0_g1_i1.p1 TRINITY_DN4417_c0_g1~~TRINITY_DN4417_c0_g1_i1.p1  ORF type:complete len:554 (-),score=135.72 TRINITY_DN4417_c0_g1_i1:68-1729(-)